jgi:hypothetical protein
MALDAALLAQQAPRPVRIQWTRDDALAWSPFGSPMVMKIASGMTADGKIAVGLPKFGVATTAADQGAEP